MERRVAVFLNRSDPAALRMAGSCALAAAAMGDRVQVFLLGDAVRAVVEAAGDDPDAPGATLLRAREAGSCQVVACSQGVVESGLDPAAVQEVLDAVVGWATILEWTRGVAERFSF
jgi:peroxiredoxin family protein